MRMVLFLAPFVLFLGALFIGAYQFLWNLNTVTSEYWTYEKAVADSLFERGWLPDFIPVSATRIVTVNDLDLNDSHGEFHYDPADTDFFLANLQPYQDRESPYTDYEAKVEELKSQGYRPYEYRSHASFWVFFVNVEQGHVIYDLWLPMWAPAKKAGDN